MSSALLPLALSTRLTRNSTRSIRRSGAILEAFTWDVAFDTPFEKVRRASGIALRGFR